MATHSAFVFVIFTTLYQTDPVISCSATSSAGDLAGSNISITCRTANDEYVTLWRRQNENRTVYTPTNAKANRFVADGYSVDDSNPNEITLTLQNASIQYVDNYECACLTPTTNAQSRGYTNITVIETEPKLNATDSLSIVVPMKLVCSIKFAGNANLLMQITNSAGKVLAQRNEPITTNISQQFDLYYNTSVAIENMYFCNISLAGYASDPKTTIFSRNLTSTVQFSVRNVSISPKSPEYCERDGFCAKNSVLLCKAEGNPEPTYYSFTIYHNGTIARFLANKQQYTTEYVGQQIIQCTAFNVINGSEYSQSINFTTNGTEASLADYYSAVSSNAALIGGLVGGIVGGLLLIIIIILIIIYYKRQTRKQSGETRTEGAIETKDFTKGNKGNATTTNGQTNITATSGDERVLIDNTLYSGSKGGVVYNTAIDPSDGGYAAINELGTIRKG